MATSTQWQLVRDAAERYERIAVPAILGPFAQALVEWANLPPAAFVLDVGCGTGAAARYAAAHIGPTGRVIGVDVNAGMIAVAKALPPPAGAPIEWLEQSAYKLSIPDQSVDVALCAQTLQFLEHQPQALAEIYRILKPGGRIVLSAWCDLQENPYFYATMEAVAQHLGADMAAGLRAGSRLANAEEIRALLSTAGFQAIEITVVQRDLALPALVEFVPQHMSATPLAASYSAAPAPTQQAVIRDIMARLAAFQTANGVKVPFRSYMARGER
jgi:ubiquinone/menaquinone biosynthesis C-methylase UbiE